MRKPAKMLILGAVPVILLISACGGGGGQPTPAPAAKSGTGDAAAGQQVFQSNCNGCHPGGDKGTGPALKGRNLSASVVTTKVRSGGGGMPAFTTSQISDQQLANLAAYVQSLK